MRAAAVGGAAYYAGKKVQENRDQDAADEAYDAGAEDASSGGVSNEQIAQLRQLAALKEEGVLTQEEFDAQKAKILGA
jgi:hypothetical protein